MSGSVNKVTLLGRLGNDPELRSLNNGGNVANVSLATSEAWKDQNGQKQERTEWHRVVVFGKLADVVGQYLKKGDQAYFEGRLQTRKWQDQEGKDRYSTEIVVSGFGGQMVMLGKGGSSGGGSGGGDQDYSGSKSGQDYGGSGSGQDYGGGGSRIDDDDIPF